MKQFFTLAFAALLISCNSNDDDSSNPQDSNSFFNPPAWIQGKWLVDDPNTLFGFELTNDNFIIIQSGANINYGEILEMQDGLGVNVSTTEDISNSEYKLTINIQGTSTVYHFTKLSTSIIKYSNTNFYKQ